MAKDKDNYGLSTEKKLRQITPPNINYLPRLPKNYNPKIGLIGTGGISDFHLRNYKKLGLQVMAISDRNLSKARTIRDKYFPDAKVYENYNDLLNQEEIEVVDITPHPQDRLPILKKALNARKHVLSQKPLVLDLKDGEELVNLAKKNGVKLAVNQNGRWAPHFSYMREAIGAGIIGRPISVDFSLQWDQTWIAGNPAFEAIHHMVLLDFSIHWFDIAAAFMQDQQPLNIYASTTSFREQKYTPPALASCIINYEQAQVRMGFNAHTTLGEEDVTTIVGTKGTLRSRGPGLNDQPEIELFTEKGCAKIPLEGSWFENGFQGTMGELLCAIEENREPTNNAASNLRSLELCFAALESADKGKVIIPGSVRTVP
ncbi:Gfo/Idh/MocA family oxidoreductase [Salegentibacter mishustinae]|uniref:Gfo/Idh/MocA family protein n=1 Tax=Salegentibacter mishustinae TaxID=270918 RepID=UPI001CE081E1|nr:Gfo/Idh/MocA family oxidoreductase [Salegentibacter mishustinae]UBZ05595.1 Gfo/Idh/MocA family oxidoreductase [Salegentibacter mishustinae]